MIGVSKSTFYNWEQGRSTPAVGLLPAVVRFLVYDPTEGGTTLGKRLRANGAVRGLSQRALADHLGIDESSVTAIERGRRLGRRLREVVAGYLGDE